MTKRNDREIQKSAKGERAAAGKRKNPRRPKNHKGTKKEKNPAMERNKGSRQQLLKMKEEILSQVPAKSGREAHEPAREVDDEAAVASIEISREVFLLLTVRNREKLRAIEEALKKIEKETFGICEECENKIEPARLKAMPLAKFCLDCQSQWEKEIKIEREFGAGFRIPFDTNEVEKI
jgi:DnaK suppressor protein